MHGQQLFHQDSLTTLFHSKVTIEKKSFNSHVKPVSKESLKKTFERMAICCLSIFKEAVLMKAVRMSNYSENGNCET